MSSLKHVILQDKDTDNEKKLDWSYIEWAENEVVTTGVADAETQTDSPSFEHKESQTSNPVIMHIDLKRTHSKMRHLSLVNPDNSAPPFFQFDRQAPGRISTSPTLRRMRSTRRPQIDFREPHRMGSTQEEQSSASTGSPISPLSPGHRVDSPLAASPLSDGEANHQPVSSSGQQRSRSHRSKTFDNSITSVEQECHSAHPFLIKDNGFPEDEVQVSFYHVFVNLVFAYLLRKKMIFHNLHTNLFPITTHKFPVIYCRFFFFWQSLKIKWLHIPSLRKTFIPSIGLASRSGHSQCKLLTANESAVTCTDSSDQAHCLESPGKCSPRAPIHRSQQSPNNGGVSERWKKIMGRSIHQLTVFKRADPQ